MYHARPLATHDVTADEAIAVLRAAQLEEGPLDKERLDDVRAEILARRTYTQTPQELAAAARLAWRHNNRCIGRIHWRSLVVRDRRQVTSAREVFSDCVEHLRVATNGGKVKPTITVFRPEMPGHEPLRIWNPQLVSYAGFEEGRRIIGDRGNASLTLRIQRLGWQPERRDRWCLLPLVVQMPGEPPEVFELPRDVVLEVPIEHPTRPSFAELDLRWYAVPVISSMLFDAAGARYPAAPFNGWYMGTEISARDLADAGRYDVLPSVIAKIGGRKHRRDGVWIDRALVELNVAVLHSFAKAGVTIVDHHTASRQLMRHIAHEARHLRRVTADWSWIVPPISGAATQTFHRYYDEHVLLPNFFYQHQPWA